MTDTITTQSPIQVHVGQYPVNNIYPCVQGEGVQTGVAMVLLRLHGCGVGCPWCDTKETWDFVPEDEGTTLDEVLGTTTRYVWLDAETIASTIAERFAGPKWVLLTGGEPAQYHLVPLVEALHRRGYKVAIETSGTESGHFDAGLDWVCVSPKLNMPGGKAFRLDTLSSADEIKFVVGKPDDIAVLEDLLAQATLKPDAQILLQPVSQSPKATRLCIDTVQTRGWRLSIQIHKYLDLP
jgi:7-carboxy-7-deazaguanine synthase